MSITQKDIRHIAHLARIELTGEEQERFAGELSGILGFVGQLNELDTTGVTPVNGGTDLEHVMRKDAVIDASLEGHASELMDAVSQKKDGRVRVKAVFE